MDEQEFFTVLRVSRGDVATAMRDERYMALRDYQMEGIARLLAQALMNWYFDTLQIVVEENCPADALEVN